ncbi:MAG: hypothetical protein ACXADY_23445 [Candidatus Hodarchaeales archaeon]|jgi:integrase
MKKYGKVQPELRKLIKRDYNRISTYIDSHIKNKKPINPKYTIYKSLKELLKQINDNKIEITWNNGLIEHYDPEDLIFYPSKLIVNQSIKTRKIAESMQSIIKSLYHDSAGNQSLSTYNIYSQTLQDIIVLTKMTNINELENRETYNKYIIEKQKPLVQSTGGVSICREKGIKQKLIILSAIFTKLIKYEIDFNGFTFTKNRASLASEQWKVIKSQNHYISREIEEIEYWINSQTSIRNKAIWSLYAHGLRNHEIRLEKVKEKTSGSFKINKNYYNGLQINQIDFNRKCLTNVKRKGLKMQKFTCLDNKTITLLKNWLNYRKQFHPEIENDPVLSKFVFSIKDGTIVSKLGTTHFKYLKKKLESKIKRLERKKTNNELIPPALTKEINILTKIIKNGKITPHQLRHSWDILATRNNMRDYLRRYHLNHTLKGMDHVYVAPHITYEEYREEYDKNAPKFNIIL